MGITADPDANERADSRFAGPTPGQVAGETDDEHDSTSFRKRQQKESSPRKRGRKDKFLEHIEDDDLALLNAETARRNSITAGAEEAKKDPSEDATGD